MRPVQFTDKEVKAIALIVSYYKEEAKIHFPKNKFTEKTLERIIKKTEKGAPIILEEQNEKERIQRYFKKRGKKWMVNTMTESNNSEEFKKESKRTIKVYKEGEKQYLQGQAAWNACLLC